MNIRTTKGIGAAAVVIAYILLSSILSWGATTVYVYQAASSGALTIKTIDENGTVATPAQTVAIPNSCAAPDLFWDSDAGALRLNGFGADKNPSWTGTINANGQFSTTMAFQTISCTSVAASVVSAAFPDTIPTLASSQACTDWSYGPWTPLPCAAGSIQTRIATGIPAGCVGGFPDDITVQSCPAPTCTTFTYACSGTCAPTVAGATTGTCPAVVQTSFPSGCIGGTPAATTTCTVGVACTGYNYSAWGTCTNGSQSRTVTGYTPANCSGTPSAGAVLTQSCSATGGVTVLPFNGTSQSFQATITPGSTKIFSCTIPAGQTSTRAGMALVDQYPGMDMLIVQGTQTADAITSSAAQYYTEMAAWYAASSLRLGSGYYKTYPPTVWAKRDPTSTAGETLTLKQSTGISSQTTTTLPGTYYIIVKNANTTRTIRFYLYWKTY